MPRYGPPHNKLELGKAHTEAHPHGLDGQRYVTLFWGLSGRGACEGGDEWRLIELSQLGKTLERTDFPLA
jgi:hypothetical protein